MEKGGIILVIFSLLALNIVIASSYSLEFNQTGNKMVVMEGVDGLQNRSYVDSDSLNFAGKEIYFLNKVTFPENFSDATLILNLEKGIVIKNKEIFPLGYNIKSDGQTISINWNLTNVKKGDNFAIFVNLENTNTGGLSYLAIIIFSIILLGIILFLIYNKKNKNKSPIRKRKARTKESGNYDYLLDTEKKIIEELKKADRNELWQKQIQNSTGFSKAKVSRLVRNLESRGLVKKIPFGNTNKIRLK
jgi:uncharacterized membrane protein